MFVGLGMKIVIGHSFRRRQAPRMDFLRIVAAVPSPNVRRFQHGRSPVVASALINRGLAILLPVRRPKSITLKIGRVARAVVAVFVIDDSGILGSVCPVARPVEAAGSFHKCAIVEELPAGTEMNFATW